MASNVFGSPLTDKNLKPVDRARMAMEMKNEGGKDVNARKMAEYLKDKFGENVATMVLIYNATGNTITFFREYEWEGHLCESPYPCVIYNGQWGVFLHGKYSNGPGYSKAAVVYNGKNSSGKDSHWCLAWANNRAVGDDHNRVLAEIFPVGHYNDDTKHHLLISLDKNRKRLVSTKTKRNGGYIVGSIGDDKITVVEAILTLPDAIN